MGVIWERYRRDKNHLSHTASPLYKGVSEDYGSDEALPQKSIKKRPLLTQKPLSNLVI